MAKTFRIDLRLSNRTRWGQIRGQSSRGFCPPIPSKKKITVFCKVWASDPKIGYNVTGINHFTIIIHSAVFSNFFDKKHFSNEHFFLSTYCSEIILICSHWIWKCENLRDSKLYKVIESIRRLNNGQMG